jgi:hypothetical protein
MKCPVRYCERECMGDGFLLCASHWELVPVALRNQIYHEMILLPDPTPGMTQEETRVRKDLHEKAILKVAALRLEALQYAGAAILARDLV